MNCGKDLQYKEQGQTKISSSFIRNKGESTCITQVYDEGWPDYLVNNPPPIQIFVRIFGGVFYLNGIKMPTLILKRGQKYQFNVVTGTETFYFTKVKGGAPFSHPPTNYSVYTIIVDESFPACLYYTSSVSKNIGGLIQILGISP